MTTYREQDPLVALLVRAQERVLACLTETADRGRALAEARQILTRLAEAETNVLFPAFVRVRLRPEAQHLLDDSRGVRDEQLAELDVLARKRQPRLRKLAAIQLAAAIARHNERLSTELVAVLSSQLPRPVYRALAQMFVDRYEGVLPVQPGSGEPAATAIP